MLGRRRSGQTRTGKGRLRERGAVLVELTIVTPLLMTMVLGIFEIAMAWSAAQSVVQSSRSGARTVSQLGLNELSDQAAVFAVAATLDTEATGIERIVIWEVPVDVAGDPTTDAIPPLCLTTDPVLPDPLTAGVCNIYDQADVADVANIARFDDNGATAGCGTGRSANWCPSTRDNEQQTATYVGVYVQYRRDWLTGFFGPDSHTITEQTIMRIEPGT